MLSDDQFFKPPVSLTGEHVRLEPIAIRHAQGLYEIGREASIWEWLFRGPLESVADAEALIGEMHRLRDAGDEFPFVVVHKQTGKVLGSTRFLEISEPHRNLEIGWTWYGVDYQRTPVNTECKLLLLQYAFEQLGAIRVQLKTDARNLRSQTAILRLGAHYEGTLRNHRIVAKDGFIRDTVLFSIIDFEWPAVKAGLIAKLS